MELTEYRQITGGIGVALFVSGMAVWPAGVTAKPWNWALWGIGVVIALLGVYVFVAGINPNRKWRLPGKKPALKRASNKRLLHATLGLMRLQLSQLDKTSPTDKVESLIRDVIDLVTRAYGLKHMTLLTPTTNDPEYSTSFRRAFDDFVARCDQLEVLPEFEFDTEWLDRYFV